MRGERPGRRGVRVGWLLGGVTTGAAATVAAVAFTVIPGPTLPSADPTTTGARTLSGQELLWAAAALAESQPASSGTYWHVTRLSDADVERYPWNQSAEWWIASNGDMYVLEGSGVVRYPEALYVARQPMTLAEVEQLPTDEAALLAWITDPVSSLEETPDPGLYIALELSHLLWAVPAPPAVRAAAFRALAGLGNVTNLGEQDGHWVVRISLAWVPPADRFPGGVLPVGIGEWTMIIDPTTSRLVGYATYEGSAECIAEWTDDLPQIVREGPRQDGGVG